MLQEVYNPSLCISLHLQIIMNQWNTERWMKTLMWCVWRYWRKLFYIIWVCRGTGECVGWSTAIIFSSRESRVGSNKAHNYRSATKGSLMNSGWRPKRSFIGQINDFWTSITNVLPQNRTFWCQKKQINACMLRMLHMCACNIKTKKKWKLAWTCNGPFWQITRPFPWKQCISCSTDGPFSKKIPQD